MGMGMAIAFLGVLALLVSNSWSAPTEPGSTILSNDVTLLNRSSFPAGFIFGTASSAYQYEGAANEGGRGPSIWDTLTHQHPEKVQDGSNGDVAVDQYHRYKEDVAIMKYMNTDAYRFSISWSRILPKGKISSGINQEGIKYYNNLINELIANGLEPFATLFHFDLPQALQDEYSGFYSPNIIKDFEDYSELCFKEFGDRVKHWITLNEPWSYSVGVDKPYLATHYQLLAHAASVQIYKAKYQVSQKGLIGITLNSGWFLPYSNNTLDVHAAQRALDFAFGCIQDPWRSSFDFIGLNYYTSNYAAHLFHPNNDTDPTYWTDQHVNLTSERNGIPIGPRAASSWLYVYPKGIEELLLYITKTYNNPLIYITENGIDEFNDPTLSLEEALIDTFRIDYHYRHLYYVSTAIKDGANVKGYFAWSLLDNFEWFNGYTVRFGINFVDYKDNLKRHQKLSAGSPILDVSSLNRSSFPAGFVFGTATSSYQEDIKIMKDMNTDAYRFSISWARILPKGKVSEGINQEGIAHYNKLINELLANGMQPFVTLFHWDLPQALQDEYKGFNSPNITKDFEEYADMCFKNFGERVKHWITLNEPWSYSMRMEQPYMSSHYQLLAHAAAVKLYKTKYQASQKGLIGITLNSNWFIPFMDPLTKGDYPKSMRTYVGNRLPKFTEEEAKILIGSYDFIGINYYTSNYAAHLTKPFDRTKPPMYATDPQCDITSERDGRPIGQRAASHWLYVYPKGIEKLLLYTTEKYNNPLIYITENGMDEFNDPTLTLEEALMDTYRIDYYYRHLYHVLQAIKGGANVKGYFAWTFSDNFEWNSGYNQRFGLVFIDYKDNLKRHQKLSARWFGNFLKRN
ncbi:hypothetical protein Ahy_B03g068256 isoform C [Arachis hypogaea]|nr:hypothetical protein Ahy_B03g068256 isoform C [Arachis hypogaea]